MSEDRRALPWRTVGAGLALQIALALLLLKAGPARTALLSLNGVVDALMAATHAGTAFVFGYVGGAAPPFAVTSASGLSSFAFQVLPLVIVISALAALLWHWRVLPLIVGGFANLGSVGIMIASITGMAPERRADIVPLALRALVSGTLASAMTGAVIGLLPIG